MAIRVEAGTPLTDELWCVFDTTGWNDEYPLSPAELRSSFEASWFVAGAYADGRLVGVGRVVSDTILHAMIYDLIVIPESQGSGIGQQLLARLVDRCTTAGIRDIQLFCARGKRPFYEKRGFVARPEDAPGMQYVLAGSSWAQVAPAATAGTLEGVVNEIRVLRASDRTPVLKRSQSPPADRPAQFAGPADGAGTGCGRETGRRTGRR